MAVVSEVVGPAEIRQVRDQLPADEGWDSFDGWDSLYEIVDQES